MACFLERPKAQRPPIRANYRLLISCKEVEEEGQGVLPRPSAG